MLAAAQAGRESDVARLFSMDPLLVNAVPRVGIIQLPCTWLRQTAMMESLHSYLLSVLNQAT